MIPFTVSYFLNRQTGGKSDGVLQALRFLPRHRRFFFTGIGVLHDSYCPAPSGVVQLGNSPWVNGFIASGVRRVRTEPAGRLRIDASFGHAHQIEPGF